MKEYTAYFHGCTKGAIGIRYQITTTTFGADEKAAELALYDRYEHISGLRLREVKK